MIDYHVLTGYTVQYTQILFNTMYIFESIIPFQVIQTLFQYFEMY
jgi:hypothetical protein